MLTAAHAYQFLSSLTPEQASGLVSAACAVGALLLQLLTFRRERKAQ
ncbi:hypothetical protein IC235_17390 [Hymenobacter sp. BT664]|uniref:Uncharacterized protein n=1 Tax=Hymenobacter montanus TaxID=2771359 RepID=A0A927BGN8_9BACT|nr:hypothetical protein [Hymenobacter montanus]MBD2769667.1 hypothetical protein [Hymenobacter montanus]